MKAIVVYKSKSGFTKNYAQWIGQELAADVVEASGVNISQLEAYDTVIFGGGLYAVGINGLNLIKKNLDKLQGKKIVVFATGATPTRDETTKEIRDNNFTAQQQKHIQFFYLRGGFDASKLKPMDKLLMKLLKLRLKTKKKLTLDEKGMLAAYSNPVDFTNKKNIAELISSVKSG